MSGTLIPGVQVQLGTVAYTMPPCGFDVLEAQADALDAHLFSPSAAASASPLPKIKLAVDLVHGALRRNYPEITRELVAQGITVDNAPELLAKAISQSLPPTPPALAAPEREGEGAATLGESPGAVTARP